MKEGMELSCVGDGETRDTPMETHLLSGRATSLLPPVGQHLAPEEGRMDG